MVLSSLTCPLTVQGDTLGSQVTLELPCSGTLAVRYRCGSRAGTVTQGTTGGRIPWVPPVELAAEYPELQRIPVELTVELLRGGRVAESRRERLLLRLPETVLPQGTITVTDASGAQDKCGSFVWGVSRAAVQVEAQGSAGAAVQECRVSCGPLTGTGTRLCFDLPKIGVQTIKARIVDSRGREQTLMTTIRVLARVRPQGAILSARACDASGEADDAGAYLLVEAMGSVTNLPNLTSAFTLAGLDGEGNLKTWLLGETQRLETSLVIPKVTDLELRVSDGLETVAFPYSPGPLIDMDIPGRALGIGRRGNRRNAVSMGLPLDMGGNGLTGLPRARENADALPLGQAEERYLGPQLLWENPSPETGFPAGEIPAEGGLFLVEGLVKPGGLHFWEVLGENGCLRAADGEKTAVRPVRKTAAALVFGTADPGDEWAIPLRVFRLLPGKETQ